MGGLRAAQAAPTSASSRRTVPLPVAVMRQLARTELPSTMAAITWVRRSRLNLFMRPLYMSAQAFSGGYRMISGANRHLKSYAFYLIAVDAQNKLMYTLEGDRKVGVNRQKEYLARSLEALCFELALP